MTSQDNKNNNNFQYASMTPSVASILNLATVQDKKKPVGKMTGLSLGLAINKSQPFKATASKPSQGILKLKPQLEINRPDVCNNILKTNKALKSLDLENAANETLKELDRIKSEIVLDSKTKQKVSEIQIIKSKSNNFNTKEKTKSDQLTKTKIQKYNKKSTKSTFNPENRLEINHFDPAHWRLFVGNLGPEVNESLLLTTFQNSYPSTSRVLIVNDWKTQKSKGYGFVAFAEGKEFLRALKEMQGKWIGNRQCIIKKSEHQPISPLAAK